MSNISVLHRDVMKFTAIRQVLLYKTGLKLQADKRLAIFPLVKWIEMLEL